MLSPLFMPKSLVKVLVAAYNEEENISKFKAAGKNFLGKVVDKVSAGQDLTATFNNVIKEHGVELREIYKKVFSEAAKAHNMYVVAGSNYAPDEETGKVVNSSYIFGPDGECLGYQNKIHLYIEDTHICSSGSRIKVFPTDFGKIGLPICYEGMFPEISRVMVLKGAKALINVSACPGETCFAKIRGGAWARVQDNQVFGIHSCLVGRNDLSKKFKDPYRGQSSILAPIEYTKDLSGILAEAPSLDKEYFLTEEWDFDKLEEIKEASDTNIQKDFRLEIVKKYYSNL